MQAKRWPQERYAELGKQLLADFPSLAFAIFGSAEESPVCEALRAQWGPRSFNLSGKLSIWESAAALRRCAMYLGNDTGTMHLAALVGLPCVAIFSARSAPGAWDPHGEGHVVLRSQVPCEGCGLEECVEMKQLCLTQITVEEARRATRRVLSRLGAS